MKTSTLFKVSLLKFVICLLFMLGSSFFIPSNAQIITTFAGNGTAGYSGDGGNATSAKLSNPYSVTYDSHGNLYISDPGNERIRLVTKAGTIITIAGNGTAGFSGDGGNATLAELQSPKGIGIDMFNNIYIADNGNNCIREVSAVGTMTTVAGNGTAGYSGDGSAATSAELDNPYGVAVDPNSGNIYIADAGNNCIRVFTVSGNISTFAGNGTGGYSGDGGAATSAELNFPVAVAVDASGNVYIADASNNRVRMVNASGIISTVAGNGTAGFSGDGGTATSAELNYPFNLTFDGSGNLYITDYNNERIREVKSGIINTVAGNGTAGYSGDGGQATSAEINNPRGLIFDNNGNYYIADAGNNRIRVTYLSLDVTTSVISNVSCDGLSNGSASASASNGTTPYSYLWMPGSQSTSTASALSAGQYTITVTDNKNISGSATVTITQPFVSASLLENPSGSVIAEMTGGTSPYTYSWSPSSGLSCTTCQNPSATPTVTTTYTVTITDNSSCTSSSSVTVNVNTGSGGGASSLALPPIVQWTYGASGRYSGQIGQDWIYDIIQSHDGYFYGAGYTNYTGCSTIPVIIKLDANGNKIWEQVYLPPGCSNPFGTTSYTCDAIYGPHSLVGGSGPGTQDVDGCFSGSVMSSFYNIKEVTDPAGTGGYGIIAEGGYAEDICTSSSLLAGFPMPNTSIYGVTCKTCTPGNCPSCPSGNNDVYPSGNNPDNYYVYAVEINADSTVIRDAYSALKEREFWANMLIDKTIHYYWVNTPTVTPTLIATDPIIDQGGSFDNIDYVYNSSNSTAPTGLIIATVASMESNTSNQPGEAMLIKLDQDFNLDHSFGNSTPSKLGYGLYYDPNNSSAPTVYGGIAVINNNSGSQYYITSGIVYPTSSGQALCQRIVTNGSSTSWTDDPTNSTLTAGFPAFTHSLIQNVPPANSAFAAQVKYVSGSDVLVNTWCNSTELYGPVDFYTGVTCGSSPGSSVYTSGPGGYLTMQDAVLKIDLSSGTINKIVYTRQFEGIDFSPKLTLTADGGYAIGGDLSFNLVSSPDAIIPDGVHLGVYNDIIKFDASDNEQYDQIYMINSEQSGLLCQGPNIQKGVGTNCIFGFAATSDNGFILAGNTELNGDDYYAIKVEPPQCSGAYVTATSQLKIPPSNATVIRYGTIINSNTTWTGNYLVQGYVDIQAPNTLTIAPDANIQFANIAETGVESKIVVEPGARLDVKGTLTSMNSCVNEIWDGIELRGNASLSQGGSPTNQGQVIMEGTSTLSNANLGIFTMKINTDDAWDNNHTGGYIYGVSGSNFINNNESIDMQWYNYYNPNISRFTYTNKSYFNGCNFQTTPASYLPVGYTIPNVHVCLNHVYGINLTGNHFRCDEAYTSGSDPRGIGINSLDASYNVTNCSCISFSGCCGTGNYFDSLSYGILATSANNYGVTATGNTFTNNYFDIMAQSVISNFSNNTFSKTGFGSASVPIVDNIYLQNCFNYIVTNNSFSTSSLAPYTNAVVANISGSNPNRISYNTFSNSSSLEGLMVGAEIQGNNSGLVLQCNTFHSPIYTADISVTPSGNAPGDIPDQGDPCNPSGIFANNAFSNTCTSVSPQAYDIYNNSADNTFNYFASAGSEPNAGCYNNKVNVVTCLGDPTTSCTPPSPIWWMSQSTMYTSQATYKGTANALTTILDSGNAVHLYRYISAGYTPARLQDSMLAAGPYLSDGVLSDIISLGLPYDTMRNILVPNAPLDNSVLTILNSSGYTSAQKYRIDTITGVSAHTQLQESIQFYNNESAIYTNAIINHYVNDTIAGNIDSALNAFSYFGGYSLSNTQLAEEATLQSMNGDTTSAKSTISTISTTGDTNFTNFCNLMPIVMRLQYKPNNYFALKSLSSDSSQLQYIARDSNDMGFAQARSLLEYVYNLQFAAPIINLTFGGGHDPVKHNKGESSTDNITSSSPGTDFRLYPNPAKNSLTIAYSLNAAAQEVNIIMYDMVGNKVANWSLPSGISSNTIVNENISSLAPGMYFYTIFEDNKIVQRNKLVIER